MNICFDRPLPQPSSNPWFAGDCCFCVLGEVRLINAISLGKQQQDGWQLVKRLSSLHCQAVSVMISKPTA